MVTTGMDNQFKVWDLRNFKSMYEYYTPRPATSVSISHTGVVAVGTGTTKVVYKDMIRYFLLTLE